MKSIVFTLLFITQGVLSLRNVSLEIPNQVTVGDVVRLSCQFHLEDQELYSIKWYRDDTEFYRFLPNNWPQKQHFSLPGINLDMARSAVGTIYLKDVDLTTTGMYKCEVSADVPYFDWAQSAQKRLLVTERPISGADCRQFRYSLFTACAVLFVGLFLQRVAPSFHTV